MKRKINGFTLIELLVTVILLSLVATIVIYNTTSMSHKSKEREYESFVAAVKSAAVAYSSQNTDVFSSLYVDKSYMYITVGDLVSNGYLDENLINPWTKERIGKDELIKAVLDSATGALTFDYPAEDSNTEQFLVSIDDYVIFGEPYDCMTGVGTYKLTLSDENGDFIIKDDTDASINKLINDYQFECSYPSSWVNYTNPAVLSGSKNRGDKDHNIKYTDVPGTYDITYTWYSKSGTRKQQTRRVTVLEKFQPGLDVRKVEYDYNSEVHNATQPNISASAFENAPQYESISSADTQRIVFNQYSGYYMGNNQYRVLAFKPTLNGADLSSTTYKITKSINTNSKRYVTDGSYQLTSNSAFNGEERSDFNRIYVAQDGDVVYNVTSTTSGHYYTKYTLSTSMNIELPVELEIPDAKVVIDPNFDGTYETSRYVYLYDSYSPVGIVKYEYRMGVTSTPSTTDQVTNSLFNKTAGSTKYYASVLSSIGNGDCPREDKTIQTLYIRAINADGYAGSWTPVIVNITNNLGLLLYKASTQYVQWNGIAFKIIDKVGTTADVTPVTPLRRTGATTISKNGTWSIVTCDGTFYASYTVQSPTCDAFRSKIAEIERDDLNVCDFSKVFVRKNWDGHCAFFGYSGIPTKKYFDNKKDVLGLDEYWLNTTTNGYNTFVQVSHGESTQIPNTFFYLANGTKAAYAGGDHPLRTIHTINAEPSYICQGDGKTVLTGYDIAKGC